MNKIGYCCINVSLNVNKSKKDRVLVNRGMIKKTFESKGLSYTSDLIIKNVNDLEKILKWNVENDIFIYRMSSDMFPLFGFYNLRDLPQYEKITQKLKNIGDYAKHNNIRLSFHPSHFCVIASEKINVYNNAIGELNKHAEIMDLMGLEQSTYYPINIHVNSTKPTHKNSCDRFCENFNKLSDSAKKRLTIENDDGVNKYSVKMLYNFVYNKIGIPIVFDFHHYKYGPQDQSMEDSLKMALSTWKTKPMTHMSSSKRLEVENTKYTAHSDYIYEKIPFFEKYIFDCEIEAKSKDKAVLKYFKDFFI